MWPRIGLLKLYLYIGGGNAVVEAGKEEGQGKGYRSGTVGLQRFYSRMV